MLKPGKRHRNKDGDGDRNRNRIRNKDQFKYRYGYRYLFWYTHRLEFIIQSLLIGIGITGPMNIFGKPIGDPRGGLYYLILC